mgnify:FL=1
MVGYGFFRQLGLIIDFPLGNMISMVAISGSKSQITGSGPTIIVLETEFECFGDLTHPRKSTNFLALHYLLMITLT